VIAPQSSHMEIRIKESEGLEEEEEGGGKQKRKSF
jgi:hypothetical protein